MEFHTWLKKQKHRNDNIGSLARDYIKTRTYYGFWFVSSNRQKWLEFFTRHNQVVAENFSEAWQEYKRESKEKMLTKPYLF